MSARAWLLAGVAFVSLGCSPVIGLIARVASRAGPSDEVLVLGQRVEGSTRDGADVWEPSCGAPDGGGEQVYSLRVTEAGEYRLEVEARYDAVLAVFDPDERSVGCNDDDGHTTRSALTLTLAPEVDYTVVVDGYRGATGDFTLRADRVVPTPPDVLGEALPLGQWRQGATTGRGDGVTPPCGAVEGSPEQLWTFTPERSGLHTVTVRASYDAVLAVYPPAGEGDTPLGCNDDYRGPRVSRVELELTAGQAYRVFVDGKDETGGRYSIAVARAAQRSAVRGVLRLDRAVSGDTRRGVDHHTFACGVTAGSRDDVWLYRADRDAEYTVTLDAEHDAAVAVFEQGRDAAFTCAPEGEADGTASLTTNLRRGQVYRVVVDGRAGAAGPYSLTLSRGAEVASEPAGPRCSHASQLRPGLSAGRFRAEWAQRESSCARSDGPEVIYRVRATRLTRLRVRASSSLPVTLAMERGCASPPDELACAAPDGTESTLEVVVQPGEDYLLVVDSPEGSEGTFTLEVESERVTPENP
ncbi:MAG: hypothetical protein AB8I08_07195 [Sandaracinaceae bacterium]